MESTKKYSEEDLKLGMTVRQSELDDIIEVFILLVNCRYPEEGVFDVEGEIAYIGMERNKEYYDIIKHTATFIVYNTVDGLCIEGSYDVKDKIWKIMEKSRKYSLSDLKLGMRVRRSELSEIHDIYIILTNSKFIPSEHGHPYSNCEYEGDIVFIGDDLSDAGSMNGRKVIVFNEEDEDM